MPHHKLSARQQDILARIGARGAQQIDQLARDYGLTTQSIRRDINALCAMGLARRLHGGVDLPVVPRNTPVHARAGLNSAAKRLIADWIARDIPHGATVFLGIGTTVRYAAEALRRHRNLTVVTNSVDVALILGEAEGVELHLTGGIWRSNDRDLAGMETARYFERFHATHAVVGAGGLDPVSGALDFSHGDAQVTNAILANARTCYLAADKSKWTRDAAVRVAPLSSFTTFVTDQLPAAREARESLDRSGVRVVACNDLVESS
ncbi:DeoR/GlpR family DNA-binding transcription regulator [Devosia albogilva]|uniref:DeoR/GlpR family DNA-binding transcription regulator n=1 Tax=Devosia albogilva TaxID=429726 RepID=A0ABW5QNJ3_9HYPH